MKTLEIKLDIKPIAKGRPRMGKFGAYTPAKTKKAEDLIKKQITSLSKNTYFTGSIKIKLIFSFGPNKSDSKKIRKAKENNELPMIKKPDLDNLVKLITDACNGILYKDDSQITEALAIKKYCKKDSVYLKIEEI